jgi:hypothetical protein
MFYRLNLISTCGWGRDLIDGAMNKPRHILDEPCTTARSIGAAWSSIAGLSGLPPDSLRLKRSMDTVPGSLSGLLGWRWMDVLHPDDRHSTRQLWTDSVAGDTPAMWNTAFGGTTGLPLVQGARRAGRDSRVTLSGSGSHGYHRRKAHRGSTTPQRARLQSARRLEKGGRTDHRTPERNLFS